MRVGKVPLPTSEDLISGFVATLAKEKLTYASIHIYLSAIRYHLIACGHGDSGIPQMSQLEYVLKGIRKDEAHNQATGRSWDRQFWLHTSLDSCLVYGRNFRSSGMQRCYGRWPAWHSLDSWEWESLPLHPVTSLIRRSLPSRYFSGWFTCTQYAFRATEAIQDGSVVSSVPSFSRVELPCGEGKNDQFLTWENFVAEVRKALEVAGSDASDFNGHSFRIGAATTAASRRMEDSMIKTLGRW